MPLDTQWHCIIAIKCRYMQTCRGDYANSKYKLTV